MTKKELKLIKCPNDEKLHNMISGRLVKVYSQQFTAAFFIGLVFTAGAIAMALLQDWVHAFSFAGIGIVLIATHYCFTASMCFSRNVKYQQYYVLSGIQAEVHAVDHVGDNGASYSWRAYISVDGERAKDMFDVDSESAHILLENPTVPAILVTDMKVWCVVADTREIKKN